MRENVQDLTIIGGGVMGLFTAYYASYFTPHITILEKSTIGDKKTASFGYTRSVRNDYIDPEYARLAYEARQLWLDFQRAASEPCLIECGCLNLASTSVTPRLAETYAVKSFQTLTDLHLKVEEFTQQTLQQRFPQFVADLARLDAEAGFMYLPAVTQTLVEALRARDVRIIENAHVEAIEQHDGILQITANSVLYSTHKLVITAGHGTNDVLGQLGSRLHFPIQPDRPSQCKYFIPPAAKRAQFTSDVLPVFAYLDVGVYGHPIYEGKTPGVKIGFYNPPDITPLKTQIHDVHSFVAECMPELQDAETVDVQDVDQCFYDLVADDNFILGGIPEFKNVYVGVGWRGTGYKYAPWVGKVLMQLALQEGTVYDIKRFNPYRFANA
ncbi:MAG: hypothetical protein NVS2B12_40570 [Ktedonobacteraceae bacterium]